MIGGWEKPQQTWVAATTQYGTAHDDKMPTPQTCPY